MRGKLEYRIISVDYEFLLLCINYAFLLQPHVDFGLKLLGADLMAIPGLYRYVQVSFLFLSL